jgi:hypothetical protein
MGSTCAVFCLVCIVMAVLDHRAVNRLRAGTETGPGIQGAVSEVRFTKWWLPALFLALGAAVCGASIPNLDSWGDMPGVLAFVVVFVASMPVPLIAIATRKVHIMWQGAVAVAVAMVVGLVGAFGVGTYLSVRQPQVQLLNSTLSFDQYYSASVPEADITSVELIQRPLTGLDRVNGVNLGRRNVGNYHCSEYGDITLYGYTEQPPWLVIRSTSHKPIVVALADQQDTQNLYAQITQWRAKS